MGPQDSFWLAGWKVDFNWLLAGNGVACHAFHSQLHACHIMCTTLHTVYHIATSVIQMSGKFGRCAYQIESHKLIPSAVQLNCH